MLTFDKQQFTKARSSVKRSGKTLRENVQVLIVMGLAYYQDHEDTCYLTEAMLTVMASKSVKSTDIKDYIKQHANVRWHKDSKGQRFKKGGASAVVTEPEQTWFEWSHPEKVKADMDVVARAKGLTTSINNALADGKIKPGQESQALALVEALKVVA